MCLESVSSLTLGPSDIVGSSDFARSAKIGSIEAEHVIHNTHGAELGSFTFHVQLFKLCDQICHQRMKD